jgi:hypothetical protein
MEICQEHASRYGTLLRFKPVIHGGDAGLLAFELHSKNMLLFINKELIEEM